MNANWSYGTSVVARPFATADDVLSRVKFRLSADRPFDSRDSYEPSEVNMAKLAPEFELPLGDGLPEKLRRGLAVVIRLQDPRLHRSEIVLEAPMDRAPPTFRIPADLLPRYGWKAGVRAIATVMQQSDTKRVAGQPHLRGHWLARRVFTIGRTPKSKSFPVEPWPPKQFEIRGLPADTVYWLEIETDNLNRTFDDPADAFRLGIHEDVHNALAGNDQSPGTRAFYEMIKIEVVTDLLVAGLQEIESTEELQRGVLDALVKLVEKATSVKRDKIHAIANDADDGRAKIQAHVQAALNAGQTIIKLRRGNLS